MIDLHLPPKPAIIRAGEAWEIGVRNELDRLRLPIGVQIAILHELRRLQGAPRSLVRATAQDLEKFAGKQSLASILVNSFLAAASAISITYITHAEDNGGGTTVTFSTQSIGTASSDRFVIGGIAASSASAFGGTPLSSSTIGGNSATTIKQQNNNGGMSALVGLTVTSGTTATFVFNFPVTVNGCCLVIWVGKGMLSTTPTATASSVASPPSASLTISSGGFAVGIGSAVLGSTFTWTNLTEDSDNLSANSNVTGSGAHSTTAGTPTITATPAAGAQQSMCLAAFA